MSKPLTIALTSMYKRRPVLVAYVEPTLKTRETKSELLGSVTELVEIRADQRLKPENQAADLQKKLDRFIEDIADKYQIVDQQLKVVLHDTVEGTGVPEPLEGGTFTCYASDFSDQLAKVLRKLGIDEVVPGSESTAVLLVGPDVLSSWRCIMRHVIRAGLQTSHELDYYDVLAQLIPSTAWDQLTPVAKKTLYFGEQTQQEFYMAAFRALNTIDAQDEKILADYADRATAATK